MTTDRRSLLRAATAGAAIGLLCLPILLSGRPPKPARDNA